MDRNVLKEAIRLVAGGEAKASAVGTELVRMRVSESYDEPQVQAPPPPQVQVPPPVAPTRNWLNNIGAQAARMAGQ